MSPSRPKLLVTGAAGFIGSHLVDALLTQGHHVIGIDNLATGRRANLSHALAQSEFQFIESDICNAYQYAANLREVTHAFHLAGLADIVPSVQRPMAYLHANLDGTAALLEVLRALPIKRLVYAASSSCYGLATELPTPETATVDPQYPYALSKRLGEELCLHWHKIYGLPVNSLRFFNVYGPRSRTTGAYGAMFGVFLAQKSAGAPVTVVGDGAQSRDFVYVSDVVRALMLAGFSDPVGQIYNVGSGKPVAVNHIVRLLEAEPVYIPKRPGEPDCTWADIAKIRRELGYYPQVSIEAGVAQMLKHIDDWRDATVWTPATIEVATRDWFDCLNRAAKD